MNHHTRHCASALLPVICALMLAPAAIGHGQDMNDPLPDAELFLRDVRENLRIDPKLLDGYTYVETRTDADVGFFGGVSVSKPKVYRVYRSSELGEYYKRLVAVDGKPLTAGELEAQDRRHRAERLKAARKLAGESEKDRAERTRKAAEDAKKEQETIDEVLGLFEYRLVGREDLDGRPTIVVSFTPRPDIKPRTRFGKIMAKARGQAWVSEAARQVIRVEATAFKDVTIGFGLIARLHKGCTLVVRRALMNDTWMPAGFSFSGTGRTLLFRTFDVEVSTAYSDFESLTSDMLPFPPITTQDARPADDSR